MLDVKKLFTKIAKCCYVSGTSNGWTYKKYGDGTFEAVRHSTAGSTGTLTQVGSSGTYYSTPAEITFPTAFTITSVTQCVATCAPTANYLMYMGINRLTNSSVYPFYIRLGSSTAVTNIDWTLYIKGTWS